MSEHRDRERRMRLYRVTGCEECTELSVALGQDTICIECEDAGDLEMVNGQIRARAKTARQCELFPGVI